MTTAPVVEMSVTVNNNSPIQDYVHPDDHTQPAYEKTPGFKPFTVLVYLPTTLEMERAARGTRHRTNFRPIENSCVRCSVHTGRMETYKHLRRQALRTFHRQNRGQIFCR